jgi:5-formyltetrahydrofolate cyclo-ligase
VRWLVESDIFKKSETIACYFPLSFEFDTTSLIHEILLAKKKCFLPVITDDNLLHFVAYQEGDSLRVNRYGISEPVNAGKIFAAENLDLVLLPLSGFDRLGNRLGSGGGYYDRTFAFVKKNPGIPLLVGVGYQVQEVDHVPHDSWDIMLDGVLTEKGFLVLS